MNLVPLHYAAHEGHGGPSYVVSFFSGCMFVIVAFWISRFVYELYRLDGAVGRAYLALPSFHVRRIWLQGGLSGALLTLGKFATIIAVTHLGNSVGNCFAQASMLVSGLWWVFPFFFFREQFRGSITLWPRGRPCLPILIPAHYIPFHLHVKQGHI